MKIQFTEGEKEALQTCVSRYCVWPGMDSLKTLDLDQVEDTKGLYNKDHQRDLLMNAATGQIEVLIGGGQWGHFMYEDLRSALLKIQDIKNPMSALPGSVHPPTGVCLRMYLFTGAQLTKIQKEGIKSL